MGSVGPEVLLALPGSHETVSPSQELRVFLSEDVAVDTTYMDIDQASVDAAITKARGARLHRSDDHGPTCRARHSSCLFLSIFILEACSKGLSGITSVQLVYSELPNV